MSANVLQFSLGMATGGFISAIGHAQGKVNALIGSFASMGAMVAGVEKAFERGAGLEKLHKQTGESVEDLYRLQKGFTAVGLDAEDVRPAISFMQRALGGVSEMGQDTSSMFHKLGLNMAQLKNTGAANAMNTILTSIGKLNKNDAAKASAGIFGRQEAGNMLVAARSMTEFQRAIAESGPEAAVFGKVAKTFEEIERLVTSIKGKFGNLFVGVAAGLAPALKKGLEWLKSMESGFLEFGQNVGKTISALMQAFSEGSLSEVIGLALKTGFEIGCSFLPGLFEKLGAMLLKVFETPLVYLQAGMEYIITNLIATLPKSVQKAMGFEGAKHTTFAESLAGAKETGPRFNLGTGEFGIGDVNADADQRLSDAKSKMGATAAPLMAMLKGLYERAPKLDSDKTPPPPKDKLDRSGGSQYKSESTQLEKMGFVMGGAANPMKRSEDLLGQILGAIKDKPNDPVGAGEPNHPV